MKLASFRVLTALALCLWLVAQAAEAERPRPPRRWVLDEPQTLAGVGRGQGAVVAGDKLYVYGDADTGVVIELTLALEPTGRRVALTRNGRDLISHPTGLALHPAYGAFMGDSPRSLFGRRAVLYHVDWERALADGNLDHAVRAVVRDDAARAGTRPAFVRLGERRLLATADYHPKGSVRLYDPEKLRDGGRTSDPGVLVGSFSLAGRTQSLLWEEETGWLYCVQNPRAGRGWRLVVVDLEKAVEAGRSDAPGVLIEQHDFSFDSELEGFAFLADDRGLFLTSEKQGNAHRADLRARPPDDP